MPDSMHGLLSGSAELSFASAGELRKLHAEISLSVDDAKVFAIASASGLEAIYAFTRSSSFRMCSTDIYQSHTLNHKQQMLTS